MIEEDVRMDSTVKTELMEDQVSHANRWLPKHHSNAIELPKVADG
jgi:hypothetical protein